MKTFKRMSVYFLALAAAVLCTGIVSVAAAADETVNFSADVKYVVDKWQEAVEEYNQAHDESDQMSVEYVEGGGSQFYSRKRHE